MDISTEANNMAPGPMLKGAADHGWDEEEMADVEEEEEAMGEATDVTMAKTKTVTMTPTDTKTVTETRDLATQESSDAAQVHKVIQVDYWSAGHKSGTEGRRSVLARATER